jgi:hypothetical protein
MDASRMKDAPDRPDFAHRDKLAQGYFNLQRNDGASGNVIHHFNRNVRPPETHSTSLEIGVITTYRKTTLSHSIFPREGGESARDRRAARALLAEIG